MIGIYWDCDGTLMDTETSYGLAWKEYLSNFGLEIPEEEIRQWFGIDDRLVHSFYSKIIDLENFDKTMASLGKIIEGTLNEQLMFQDAKTLLEETDKRGWLSACVSASPYELLKKKLLKANIYDFFSYVIGGDLVKRNKPYPDIRAIAASDPSTLSWSDLTAEKICSGDKDVPKFCDCISVASILSNISVSLEELVCLLSLSLIHI